VLRDKVFSSRHGYGDIRSVGFVPIKLKRTLKLIRGLLFILVAYSSAMTSTFATDPVLTDQKAKELVQQLLRTPACAVAIPMGEHSFMNFEAQSGGGKHEFAQSVLALKEAGVIKIIDLPGFIGTVHFRVELDDAADVSQILEDSGRTCIKSNAAPPILDIVKVTNLKAKAKWDSALVLATQKSHMSELYRKYLSFRRMSVSTDRHFRYLFRYDSAKLDWIFKAVDIRTADGDFTSSRVLDALKQD
jgi:hypothetical protein